MDNKLVEIDRIITRFRLETRSGEKHAARVKEQELDALIRNISHHCGLDDVARVESDIVVPVARLQPEFLMPSREYVLHELLSFDDERFIDNTFRAILQRAADKDGKDYYLRKLRSGEMSKIGILSELRWSPEGLRNGIHVDGLLVRRYLDRLERTAVLGPALRWLKGLSNLHTLGSTYQLARRGQALGFRAIDESNANAAEIRALIHWESREAKESLAMAVQRLESTNETLVQEGVEARCQLVELAALSHKQDQLLHQLKENLAAQASGLQKKLTDIQASNKREFEAMSAVHAKALDDLKSSHEAALSGVRAQQADVANELKDKAASFEATLYGFDARLTVVNEIYEGLTLMSTDLEDKWTSMSTDFEGKLVSMSNDFEGQLALVLTEVRQIGADALPFFAARAKRKAHSALRNEKLGPLYSRFETRFRGSEDEISQRMSSYLDVIAGTIAGGVESPVLDLGSGRGEWLHLLRNQGLHARGVDLNPEFVRSCNNQGLAVAEMDVLEAVRSTKSNSIGAVTSMHLIEHMSFELVVEVIDESLRILKPGGLIILETPNPENIEVASHWFYMDPTHRNPIPPTLLEWVLKDRGFCNVVIRRESEFRHFHPPELLDESYKGAEQVNRMLAGYRAAPDYAVVGERP